MITIGCFLGFITWLAVTFKIIGYMVHKECFSYMMVVCTWIFGSILALIITIAYSQGVSIP